MTCTLVFTDEEIRARAMFRVDCELWDSDFMRDERPPITDDDVASAPYQDDLLYKFPQLIARAVVWEISPFAEMNERSLVFSRVVLPFSEQPNRWEPFIDLQMVEVYARIFASRVVSETKTGVVRVPSYLRYPPY